MRAFLTYLTRHSPGPRVRYSLPVLALLAVTLFRVVVPLDAAPFLLYLPVVFLVSIALGRGFGDLGTALSAVCAASFFVVIERIEDVVLAVHPVFDEALVAQREHGAAVGDDDGDVGKPRLRAGRDHVLRHPYK